ncbi:type I secretion C-terminal target domain-containing protein, partial [Mesorhizobium sp. B4-1-3]|uniref:beta strand repeat-containing protein n=1 Tax=Mesorhizobium sp. B4-1-3 TaxID=2589889 RepID=UPI00112D9027
IVVTDLDSHTATGTLTIDVKDDVPTANADTNSVAAGSHAEISGNVLVTDAAGDKADVAGADGATVTSAFGTGAAQAVTAAGTTIQGAYGVLTLHSDGSYTYDRGANTPGGVTDTFNYTLTDGDGDTSSTTLKITIGQGTPTITSIPAEGSAGALVNEAGLATGSLHDGSNATSGTIAFTSQDGVGSVTLAGHALSSNAGSPTVFTDPATGGTVSAYYTYDGTSGGTIHYSYTLNTAYHSATGPDGANIEATPSFGIVVTDLDSHTATGTLTIDVKDDVPTLGLVQSQQTNDDPAQAPAVGTLHFVSGADGVGSAMTITADTGGLTSGGHNLVTVQNGNVLTAYADVDGSHSYTPGDTAVFTLTVNPTAGTSGQYVFDLLAPLDGTLTPVSIGSGSSFGAGPTSSILVDVSKTNHEHVVMVTGWGASIDNQGDVSSPMSASQEAAWLAGGSPLLKQDSNVNGSASGWGLDNNNFDTGEFMRFDFGTPNSYPNSFTNPAGTNPYAAPTGITMDSISYATFTFGAVDPVTNKIEFVAHYVDGTFQAFTPPTGATSVTIQSPTGVQIAWIDAYESSGSTKLNLTTVGTVSTSVDHTIPFTLQLTDGDGDTTTAANFSVHVKDGLTPFAVATPVVLDLNHDGIQTTDLTHSNVSFDYNGDGVASKTAWVDSHDGILAIDLNGDGKVNNGSEIVFTQHAPGAATDLAALAQVYDTNHDGKLTAADQDFAKFGVWQDVNGNGVADAGEFKSLAALGIVEIGLESNHQQSVSADGSVVTYGEATFTTANGQTGTVGDIGFGNYDGVASGATSTIAGTSGADTFKIDNLNIKDLITDYHSAEGDKIDLTALFDKAPAGNIADYVHYNSATSTVSVDTGGSGNPANFVDVAAVQNAPAAGTINILYDDSNHQQHTATI